MSESSEDDSHQGPQSTPRGKYSRGIFWIDPATPSISWAWGSATTQAFPRRGGLPSEEVLMQIGDSPPR